MDTSSKQHLDPRQIRTLSGHVVELPSSADLVNEGGSVRWWRASLRRVTDDHGHDLLFDGNRYLGRVLYASGPVDLSLILGIDGEPVRTYRVTVH